MKSVTLFFAFLFIQNSAISQIVVVDESKNPIPYVDVTVSDQETFLWQTDRNGKIPRHIIEGAHELDTLLLHHISFINKQVVVEDLKSVDTILLKLFPYKIHEIEVSSKKPKFQIIQACFRSKKIQNGNPVYYSDGKVSYLTKNKRLKYEVSLGDHRAFENIELEKFFNTYKTAIPMGTAYIPLPEDEFLPYQFIKKHDLILKETDTSTFEILTSEGLLIGHLIRMEDYTEYSINNVFAIKKRKALNTTVDNTDFHIYMLFRNNSTAQPKVYDNFNQLLYLKKTYKYTLEHDKDQIKRHVEAILEIFVDNIRFSDTITGEYTRARGMPKDSAYKSEFWKACNNIFYYPPNAKIFDVMKMR